MDKAEVVQFLGDRFDVERAEVLRRIQAVFLVGNRRGKLGLLDEWDYQVESVSPEKDQGMSAAKDIASVDAGGELADIWLVVNSVRVRVSVGSYRSVDPIDGKGIDKKTLLMDPVQRTSRPSQPHVQTVALGVGKFDTNGNARIRRAPGAGKGKGSR